jgi:uncharacterized protein YggT (Ycf19 family)
VAPGLLAVVTLLRFLAFMVLVYVGLGWMVERYSRSPESRLRSFFRLLCSPVTRPVARLMPSGTAHRRVLAVSFGVVAALWIAFVGLSEVLRPR